MQERVRFAELNLEAGIIAIDVLDFASFVKYLEVGRLFIDDGHCENN